MTDARLPGQWSNDKRFLRLSASAYRSYMQALSFSVENHTDGVLDTTDLELIRGFTNGDQLELTTAELWKSDDHRFVIVDFADTQTSRAEHEALTKARRGSRERTAAWRARKRDSDVTRDVDSDVTRDVDSDASRDASLHRIGSFFNTSLPTNHSFQNLPPNQLSSSLELLPWSGTELDDGNFSGELAADANRRARAWAAKMTPEAQRLVPKGQPPTERNRLLGFIGDLLADGAEYDDLQRSSDRYLSDLADGIETYPKHFVSRCYAQIMAEKNITREARRNGQRLSTGQKRAADTLSLDDSSPDLLSERRVKRQRELP